MPRDRAPAARAGRSAARGQDGSTAAWQAAGGGLLTGDGVTDDTLLGIFRLLPTVKDLLHVLLTCKRFSIKCIPSPSGAGGAAAAAPPEMLCIVEDAGRRWVAGCSEQERGWVHRHARESWLGLMHAVELLRVPLVFGRAHADFTLSEGGAVATRSVGDSIQSAASTVVMRTGRHYAQFSALDGDFMFFGVIRPGWDLEGGEVVDASDADGHCFFSTLSGSSYPGRAAWEGQHDATEQGDRIGMLLDLDQGSMTIWKNDEKLGVMMAEGLTGPLCWALVLHDEGHSARIESAPAAASPTAEELVTAKAWQDDEFSGSDDDDDE